MYPYDYEDGSGLNEEHNIMDAGPGFSFHLQRIGVQGWGMFHPRIYKHPQSTALDNTYLGRFRIAMKEVVPNVEG
jgi:hypothetical protein